MKTNFFRFFLFAFSLALIMACEKEEKNPAYVGLWESNSFSLQTAAGAATAKMLFDFDKTGFTNEIFLYAAQVNMYVEMLGVKGSIEEKENQELTVSLTDIGTWDSNQNDYNWKNRTNNGVEFETLYQGYLSTSMLKDFDAVYKVEGDKLDLIIPAVNDTIHLYKK
ncbi:MAG: hypothetical protein R6W78_05390 [Bacteroidales bacterium]